MKNVKLLVQCEECDKWRLLFCKHKLNVEVFRLENVVDEVSYSCGVTFHDLVLTDCLANVSVMDHICQDPIEKLYYFCGFEPISIHCASESVEDTLDSTFLPQCEE